MKIKTYGVLICIPIIGMIVKCVTSDSSINCSPARDENLHSAVLEYKKQHPDTQITKQLVNKILSKSQKHTKRFRGSFLCLK